MVESDTLDSIGGFVGNIEWLIDDFALTRLVKLVNGMGEITDFCYYIL
jgi:hypothetical protein